MLVDAAFTARIWVHQATGSWHFVTLPDDLSREIHEASPGTAKAFGTLRVTARIGATRWKTSLFWDRKRSAYLLPIKAAVRAKEKLREGDAVDVAILAEVGAED
ncbi:hypothetical protein F183_A53740 [Bryobacterales bacterium F-183]|nr:hypothetical protein F183_A53740 [Bryobacterales bacterium F-183]